MKIVAEIGAAHGGTLDRALNLIRCAAYSGANAIKLQTWSPDTMDCGHRTIDSGTWSGMKLRDLYREAHTPWEWYPIMIDYCRKMGLEWWSTPFDKPSVDFLEKLDCPRYKIASFELVDLNLIQYVSTTLKPIILSTGMAKLDEIMEAVDTAREFNFDVDITLLKCVSGYPASPEDYNLATMQHMAKTFNVHPGLSDHTRGATVPVAAAVLGATMIEKHLTMHRSDGLDDSFASTPVEFAHMVESVNQALEAIGQVQYGVSTSELPQLALRRSLWVCADVKKGDIVTEDNLISARPADGASPAHLNYLLGKKFNRDIQAGSPMSLEYV